MYSWFRINNLICLRFVRFRSIDLRLSVRVLWTSPQSLMTSYVRCSITHVLWQVCEELLELPLRCVECSCNKDWILTPTTSLRDWRRLALLGRGVESRKLPEGQTDHSIKIRTPDLNKFGYTWSGYINQFYWLLQESQLLVELSPWWSLGHIKQIIVANS